MKVKKDKNDTPSADGKKNELDKKGQPLQTQHPRTFPNGIEIALVNSEHAID